MNILKNKNFTLFIIILINACFLNLYSNKNSISLKEKNQEKKDSSIVSIIENNISTIISTANENVKIEKKEIKKNLDKKLEKPYLLKTIICDYLVEYEVIDELLKSFALERLKFIDQGGPLFYFEKAPHFQRFEHSIGVMALIKKFNGSLMEQIVGLLHDVSHTVFSHLAENLFNNDDHEKGYQDKIHLIFLEKSGTFKILEKYGIELKDLDPDCGKYNMLEKALPEMCADRIEYNLHTGILYNIISKNDLDLILNDLKYENNKWFFTTPDIAKKFATLSLYFTKEVWASDWNSIFYKFFVEALKRAIDLKCLNFDIIHYGKDIDVINILKNQNDAYIQYIFDCCEDIKKTYKISNEKDYDFFIQNKFRGIDPSIKIKDNFKFLTQIDENFKEIYENVKKDCKNGFYIKLIKPIYLK